MAIDIYFCFVISWFNISGGEKTMNMSMCCTDYHVFPWTMYKPKQMGPASRWWFIDEGPVCTTKHFPPVTYPDDNSVISLKFGEKLIPSYNLRLVERAKATQHFYVALRWDIGHCADSLRREEGCSVVAVVVRMLLEADREALMWPSK